MRKPCVTLLDVRRAFGVADEEQPAPAVGKKVFGECG